MASLAERAAVRDQLETAHVAFFAHFRDRMHWLSTETRALSNAVSRPPLSSANGGYARSHLEREVTSTVGELEQRTRRLREHVGVAPAATMLAQAQALFERNETALATIEDALEPYGYVRPPRPPTPPRAPVALSPHAAEPTPELELPPSPAWENDALASVPGQPTPTLSSSSPGVAHQRQQHDQWGLAAATWDAPTLETSLPPADENLPPSPGLSLESLGLSQHSLRVVAANDQARTLGAANGGDLIGNGDCATGGLLSPGPPFGFDKQQPSSTKRASHDLFDLLGSPLPPAPGPSPRQPAVTQGASCSIRCGRVSAVRPCAPCPRCSACSALACCQVGVDACLQRVRCDTALRLCSVSH